MSLKERMFGSIKRISKKILLALGVVNALIFLLIVALVWFVNYRTKNPYLTRNTVLVLRLDGPLPDIAYPDSISNRLLGGPTQSLTGITEQLRKAKTDIRIGAVLLDIRSFGAGWAKADELREAIADFQKANKPIYAYLEAGSNKEYYVATACQRIYIPPVSDLNINGLDAQSVFYRGALDKFGVFLDNYQIGKYKNAPEQYTRRSMSDGQREVTNSLLDDQFDRYVNTIAESRAKTPEAVRSLIDRAPFSATEAVKEGLVTATAYREEVNVIIKKVLGYRDARKLEVVSDTDYRRVTPESLGLNQGEKIAVVYVTGVIGPGNSADGALFIEPSVGSDTVANAIKEARDDDDIKAIVLRIDSPGGSTTASDIIWAAVDSAKKKKPVVVSFGDAAASGGYYIAAAANRIIAQPSTHTGSIGVYSSKPVVKGLYDMLEITTEHISRGKNAAIFRDDEPFTPAERQQFEGKLQDFYYQEFVPKVAQGRNRDSKYIDSIGQGRVWSGAQAKELGLVDEFGGLNRAIDVAKELANIPNDKEIRRVILPTRRSFMQQLLVKDDKAAIAMQKQAILSALPEDVRRTLKYASFFERFKPGEMLAMTPFEVDIK